ncbi:MAG: LD-carboxypeptidase [Alphaproteobacteria bacterium]|nr:LD-carboxypeptidase [Alphaproteobacteria bacterium]
MKLLKKADKVIIVSPSSCIEPNALDKGINWLKNQGFEVKIAKHTYDSFSYTAGTDCSRADDINKAFADNEIKAIFCSRGGAGSTKMLDYLDFDLIKNNKKPVFGLSDSTALQNALYHKCGIVSYTGFLPVYDFKGDSLDDKIAASLQNVFNGKEQTICSLKALNGGKAKGVLIGGNLSVLCYLCGTAYFPNLENKILLLEDIGEKTYKIDLMLNQLKQQLNFDKLKGIIFGKFTDCIEINEGDGSVKNVLKNFALSLNIPVVFDFDYGHIKSRYVLPIGQEVELDADNLLLKIPSL